MAIPVYVTLTYYATPPNSYIGTTIFLSYIVLALYATFSITYSLYTQYTSIYHSPTPPKDDKLKAARTARARHIKIYTFLASISFATLSYHMLNFLIAHYLNWTGDEFRGFGAVTGDKVVRWMLESTLFQDFASQLVQDVPNATWTQIAILGTWFWNVWMARKAKERNLTTQSMRAFILLSQILPISFTICLFIVQLHLSSPDVQNTTSPAENTLPTAPPPAQPAKKPIASLHIPSTLLNLLLLAQPLFRLRPGPLFLTMLFAERFILLLPHTGLINLRKSDVTKCLYVGSGFVVANWARGRKDANVAQIINALSSGGFAVKALGWDAVLGAIVYGVLSWGGGV